MFLGSFVRRYRLPALLFSLGLSAVLLFAGETVTAHSLPLAAQTTAATETQPTMPAPKTTLSINEGARKTVLDNGLTVLTKEVHTAPVVSVQVWYRVGARDEAPGVNGIAHQLEHMLFKGTRDRPIQFGRLFSLLGSESNAFTSYDQTAYFGTVERDKLRAMLILEADRMENALINPEQLASEKRVVISELQGYENDPSFRLDRAVMRAVFPNHPYGLPVGGTKADVERFTLEQVQQYYRNYYSPDNATLVLVGDFQTEPTLAAVREIFGKLTKRGTGERGNRDTGAQETTPPRTTTPIILRQPGSAPLLQVVYPLPPAVHPDVPALKVMDYVLTSGRNSRLYQALVESGLTSDAGGYAYNLIGKGWYSLFATAVPGKSLTQIEQTLEKAIADLQTQGVTEEELQRAQAQLKADVILGNRSITNQALQLGDDQVTTGDYRYTDRLLAAVSQVTAADVQRVAKTYLADANRTVGFLEPTQVTAGQGATATSRSQTSEAFHLGPPVNPAEVAKYLPPIDSSGTSSTQSLPQRFQLKNGLQVLVLPDRSTPTVNLNGFIQAGKAFDPNTQAGLAEITADNLMNGTRTKDALTLARELEARGATLSFKTAREGVSIGGVSLAKDLPILVQTLADVLQNATFPQDQLTLSLQRAETSLKQQLDSPDYLGYRTLQQTIYPANHPFYSYPTEESLQRITDTDVVQFYREHYRPDNTVLTLVGDFDPAAVRSLLEEQLGAWQATGKPPTLSFPPVPLPAKVVRLSPVIPGKSQSITYMGYRGINRQDPRYYAALVLNEIVGGDTLSSRLGTEIRDRQALTYGIYSAFQAGQQPGLFFIQMQTAPEDASRAITATLDLLKQVHDQGVTVAEVDSAKRSIASTYAVNLADPDSLTTQILMNAVYGLSPEEIRNFTQKIRAVTPEQVNQVAKELLHPDNLVVVTAGPALSAPN